MPSLADNEEDGSEDQRLKMGIPSYVVSTVGLNVFYITAT